MNSSHENEKDNSGTYNDKVSNIAREIVLKNNIYTPNPKIEEEIIRKIKRKKAVKIIRRVVVVIILILIALFFYSDLIRF